TYTLSGTTLSGRPGVPAGYYCGNGPADTACTTVTITGTATGPGSLNFTLSSFSLGAATAFNTSTITATTPGGAGVITGTPTIGVVGCANSNLPQDIQFPTTPGLFGGNIVSAGSQN